LSAIPVAVGLAVALLPVAIVALPIGYSIFRVRKRVRRTRHMIWTRDAIHDVLHLDDRALYDRQATDIDAIQRYLQARLDTARGLRVPIEAFNQVVTPPTVYTTPTSQEEQHPSGSRPMSRSPSENNDSEDKLTELETSSSYYWSALDSGNLEMKRMIESLILDPYS